MATHRSAGAPRKREAQAIPTFQQPILCTPEDVRKSSAFTTNETAALLSKLWGRECFERDVFGAAFNKVPPLSLFVHLLGHTKATKEGSKKALQISPGVYRLDMTDSITQMEIARGMSKNVSIPEGRGALVIDGAGTKCRLRTYRRGPAYGAGPL